MKQKINDREIKAKSESFEYIINLMYRTKQNENTNYQ